MPLLEYDTFDAGSPVYDTSTVCGSYVRFLGWTSDPAYGSGGTGYITTPWTKLGKLYSGHWGTTPTPTDPTKTPATLTTENLVGTDVGSAFPTGFAIRDYADADVRVSMAFSVKTNFASLSSGAFYIGVGARLTGGTLTDAGTSTAHLLGGNGYYFVALARAESGVQYQLLRVNSGTVTRLAQTPTGNPAVGGNGTPYSTWYASNAVKVMRLNVYTNGGAVELRAYVKVGSAADTLVLSYDDTDGARLTAAGRCGFLCSNEHVVAGNIVRTFPIAYFRIRTYAGAVILNDDWQRLAPDACAAVSRTFTGTVVPGYGTTFGANGIDLTSGWYGDLRSVSTYQSRLSRSSDRVLLNSSAASKTGYYISQRAANDSRAQDRQLTFEFATGGPGVTGLVRSVGIVLRATTLTAGSDPSACYMLEARLTEDTPTSDVYLYRLFNGGAVETIARKTSGVTFTRGTTYDLRLHVETLALPDPLNGPAVLKAYLDGVQIELVAMSPAAAGVTVFSSGTVHDGSSFRVLAGQGEGFYIRSKVGSTAHIYIDEWAVGTGDPGDESEETQASIEVPTEDVTRSGTFAVPYDWSSDQSDGLVTIDHQLELDYRYVGVAAESKRRTLRFGCKAATSSEIDTLLTFWEAQRGREIPFTFTWPDGTTSYARFTMDELVIRSVTPDVSEWEASVEEVRNAP
ncbi:MAG TPA: hypothetical protein PKW35_00260 [Nannocystaceae bacterium]|nr:hypothetical protein [Nannocystaceae bacterium]